LLALYRKYGSEACGCPLRENHCWSKGAVALSAKKGSPRLTTSTASRDATGAAVPVSTDTALTGSEASAATTSSACTTSWVLSGMRASMWA
jgi:hypothetical protein